MSAQSVPSVATGQRTRAARRTLVRLDHLWLALVPLMVALKVLLTPIAPHDFWWHLAYGRTIILEGAIPTLDAFSYTRAGAPYFDQPWLAQVLMYAGYQLVGAGGLQIVQALLVAASYSLVIVFGHGWGAATRVAVCAALLAAVTAYDNWQVRPQTYALPLWIAAIMMIERWRRTGRTPWLLVPLVATWANLHGTWTLPLVLGGILFVAEGWATWHGTGRRSAGELIRMGATLAAATLATLLNPHGVGLWGYVTSLLGNRAVSELVTEWAPPRLPTTNGMVFFASLVVVAVTLWVRRRSVPLATWLALAAFGGLALSATRNIIWFGPLAALLLAPLWEARPAARRRESPVLNSMLLLVLVLPFALVVPPIRDSLPPRLGATLDTDTPVEAVAQLGRLSDPPRRLFHDSGFGSYLMWAMPAQPVFIDPRIEHYPIEQWYDYINLGNGEQIATISARYRFDGFLLHPVNQRSLLQALRRDPAWRVVIDTGTAVLVQPTHLEPKH
jgi:hypothetical protein